MFILGLTIFSDFPLFPFISLPLPFLSPLFPSLSAPPLSLSLFPLSPLSFLPSQPLPSLSLSLCLSLSLSLCLSLSLSLSVSLSLSPLPFFPLSFLPSLFSSLSAPPLPLSLKAVYALEFTGNRPSKLCCIGMYGKFWHQILCPILFLLHLDFASWLPIFPCLMVNHVVIVNHTPMARYFPVIQNSRVLFSHAC